MSNPLLEHLATPAPRPHTRPNKRRRDWSGMSAQDVLARHPPGKTRPERVLEILLTLFNEQHTARYKGVSHKTKHDRAMFLRAFFRDLHDEAGFPKVPDPRNLGGRHIQAMVDVWRARALAPSTLQTYFSFLRGLAWWIGKPGLVGQPSAYGLVGAAYQRDRVARVDRTWSAAGVETDRLIAEISAFDPHVGAALGLIQAFGLRRKEAIMLRPHLCVVPFSATGIPDAERKADRYLWVRQGSKGGRPRFLPIVNSAQAQALEVACAIACSPQAHMGRPDRDLRYNLKHFSNVVRRFGLSKRDLGVTAHGLRQEVLVNLWIQRTGLQPPVRGGLRPDKALMLATQLEIAQIAGHNRTRAASHYIGSWRKAAGTQPAQAQEPQPLETKCLSAPTTSVPCRSQFANHQKREGTHPPVLSTLKDGDE